MWVILSHLALELDHPTEAHGFEELCVKISRSTRKSLSCISIITSHLQTA